MKTLIFKALWGMSGPLTEQLEQIAGACYDGVEVWPEFQLTDISANHFLKLTAALGLRVIADAMLPSTAEIAPTFERLARYQPLQLSFQAGRDSMTCDEGTAFFERVLLAAQHFNVPASFETHRGKLLYAPWDAAYYLHQFPELRITADYSHWVNVCERLPDDLAEALDLANQRTIHVHGRVGYEEGPQVPDPSAPEYAVHLAWHEAQWAKIRGVRGAAGATYFTFTPEYGPPRYLHTLPHTDEPVSDLWRVCLWAANRARTQFGS
jgi:hypothetical protein